MDRLMHERMHGQRDKWTDGLTDRRADSYIERDTDKERDRQADGQMDGQKFRPLHHHSLCGYDVIFFYVVAVGRLAQLRTLDVRTYCDTWQRMI